MNIELSIARRMVKSDKPKGRISKPIIRISIIGISLGMIVMILAVSIVTGFQSQIRDKVIGFGSHIQINSFASNNSYESSPILIQQDFYPAIDTVDGVRHIQTYATKTGIIQTKEEIQGIIAKGVGTDFDWTFFDSKMDSGNVMQLADGKRSDSILISSHLGKKLQLKLGSKITTYFFGQKGKTLIGKYIVGGMYTTGLAEFDQQLMVMDIQHIQKLNHWGVAAFLAATAECEDGKIGVTAKGVSHYQKFDYNWDNNNWSGPGPHWVCPTQDTTIRVIITGISAHYSDPPTIPDTAWLTLNFKEPMPIGRCPCEGTDFDTYLEKSGGSGKYYTGGFEVLLDEYDDLRKMDDIIYYNIDNEFSTVTIVEQFPEIFGWLEMIDVNVEVIIILMILVAVINMTSALLVLILEKTTMIGILKSMGLSNWNIRKVFLYNAIYLVGKGLFWGNVIGVSLCLLQQYTGILTLPQDSYYISEVPISINWWHIFLLNLGTVFVCFMALIAPTFLITRISAIKAIRFT